jgi:heat-inducible transcriptional repressor
MTPDDAVFPSLTRRQEEILSLIIRGYSQAREPVSSKLLTEMLATQVSSATIRNEMSVLEELGLIAAPHTSAGRVPTENGYRYYVQFLNPARDLSSDEETQIAGSLQAAPLATEQWLNAVASALARAANTAALVTAPAIETSLFKHLELIAIQGRLVLMVLVLQQGSVHQQMLTLAEPVPQPRLSEAAAAISSRCAERSAAEVRMQASQLPMLERELAELCAGIMEKASAAPVRLVYRDGLAGLVASFQSAGGAEQALRVIEERDMLTAILNDVLRPEARDVQVVIGGNGRWEALRQLTIILTRYGVPGQASGAIGVLGPTHLNYERAISAVSYVSGVMTTMFSRALESDTPRRPPADPALPAGG